MDAPAPDLQRLAEENAALRSRVAALEAQCDELAQAHRRAEERFTLVTRLASDLVYERDLRTDTVVRYGDFEAALGYAPGEFPRSLEPGWWGHLHPEDAPRVLDAFRRHVETREPVDIEYRTRRKDGTYARFRDRGTMIWTDDPPHRFLSVATDVTEARRAAAEIAERRDFLRALIDILPVAVFAKDEAGRFVMWNRESERLFGLTTDNVMGRTDYDFFPPDQADFFRAKDREVLAGGEAIEIAEEPIDSPGRGRLFLHTRKVPVRDAAGRPTVLLGISTDITERKRTEQALKESEERYRRTFEAIPAPSYLWARQSDGRIVLASANTAAFRITNEGIGEFLGVELDTLFADRPAIAKAVKDVLDDGGSIRQEMPYAYRSTGETKRLVVDYVKASDHHVLVITEDVTERRRAEEALRASEEKYRSLIENLPLGMCRNALDGTVLHANPALAAMFGFGTAEEMIGTKAMDRYQIAEDRARIVREIREKGFVRGVETPTQRRDGTPLWVSINAHLVIGKNAGETWLDGVIEDITERRRAQEAAREREETFRALAENSLDTIMRFDREGRHLYVNPVVEKVTGIPPAAFIGKTHREMGFPEALVELWEGAVRAVFATGSVQRTEFQLPSGVWIDWVLVPEFDEDRGVKAAITAARDVTENRNALRELRASEERYRRLTENARDLIWRVDYDGTVRYINAAARLVLGREPAESIGLTRDRYMTPESVVRVGEAVGEALRSVPPRDGFEAEVEYLHRDGRAVPCEIRASFVRDGGGRVVAIEGISRDLTEKVRVRREKEQLEEQLRQAQKMEAIGRLAGGVAHDFNNLLMGIVGGTSILRQKLSPASSVYPTLKTIEQAAQSAATLTNQLLAFARGGKYLPAPLDLNEVTAKSLELMRSSVLKNVRVSATLAAGMPLIEADRTQVFQVLMNLCQNAVDAMGPKGRIAVETWAAAPDALPDALRGRDAAYNVLSIWDDGPGIPAALREHVFDPFYTTKDYGRGLGLAAVYGIVQNHRGAIVLDDSPSGGARFTIYLPTAEGGLKAKGDGPAARPGTPKLASRTVLVVDDEKIPREMAASMLESIGHRVLRAAGGKQALRVFEKYRDKVDLVLLDVMMPKMDGNETFLRLLEIAPDIRVLFSSGYLEEMVLPESTRGRARGFLKKPFTVEELARAIRAALPR
jgi:PAS domain S-box-containing protein